MKTRLTTATTRPDDPAIDAEAAIPIDLSKMSKGQAAAMELAESAREAVSARDGFAARMLLGHFDPSAMLPFPRQSPEDRAIGDRLVAGITEVLTTHLDPDEADETRTIPVEVIERLRDLGVFRMKIPGEYGGLGLSQVNYNRAIQAIASYCASTAVLVSAHQSIGVPQPLKMFGTDEQKAKYLPRIAAGELSGFALTEHGVGSDPARMQTTATPIEDGRAWLLNGEKLWTTNGPISQLLIVMAQTPPKVRRGREKRQITAFIVETDTPGVEVVHRCDFMGLRAIHNGVMRFHDVRVPAENVVWGTGLGLKLALRTLNTGRLTLPAACGGLAKQCLAIAREWGRERVQWGRAIGRHEAGAVKVAEIAATAFAIEAVTWLTSHWADDGRDVRIEAAMAKLFTSEASWRLVDTTLALRGGRGYERATSLRARGEAAYPVERMMRDCRINTIIEGTSDIMRLFLAREALDPHLTMAADLLRPGSPTGLRVRTAARLALHYAAWYPARRLGMIGLRRHGRMGKLARHARYVDRSSHRLAARLFHAMARYGPKLERRQMLLGHLMDIGTELFAMSAACAYARADDAEDGAADLADLFCLQARERIASHERALRSRATRPANGVARGVLEDDFTWLEQGIIAMDGPPGDGPRENGVS